jgi:TPR repeat protein
MIFQVVCTSEGFAQPTASDLARAARDGDSAALTQLTALANTGHASAQFNLGVMYDNGLGVPKDAVQAVSWYRKGADQGLAQAQHNLGVMYEHGLGVPKDAVQEVSWFRKAADQGNAPAQFNVGLMHGKGDGVPRDSVQAYMWGNLAAAQGDEEAKKLREFLGKTMTPDQIAEAQKLSREWRPKN